MTCNPIPRSPSTVSLGSRKGFAPPRYFALACLFFLGWSTSVKAEFPDLYTAQNRKPAAFKKHQNIFIGVGTFIPTFAQLSKNRAAEVARYQSPFFIPIVIQGRFFQDHPIVFAPSLFHSFLAKKDVDRGATLTYSRAQLSAKTNFLPIDLKLGTGMLFYWIFGKAGKITLDNGNSTSTFFAPAYTSTSHQIYLTAGISKLLGPVELDLDGMISNALSKTRKNYSLLFSISLGVY